MPIQGRRSAARIPLGSSRFRCGAALLVFAGALFTGGGAPRAEEAPPAAGGPATGSKGPATPKEPFAFADFTWLTGNPRTKESPLDTKVFTGELRVDTNYVYDFNHP